MKKEIVCLAVGCISLLVALSSCKSKKVVAEKTIVAQPTLPKSPVIVDTLAFKIDSLINRLPYGSEVGISIYNLTKKKSVYTYREKKLSRPASTMKLITTISTLSYPGGKKPFATEVWYVGNIANDTLHGNIFVKGGMDPEFDDEAMNSIVKQTARFPFKVLDGQIIGDLSMKDSLYWGAGWMWDDAPYDYQPHITPLIFHKGLTTVTAQPDSTGKAAIIKLFPQSDYCSIQNMTKSNTPEAGAFNVTRDYLRQSNVLRIEGDVNRNMSRDITVSFGQNYFLDTFSNRLVNDYGKQILKSYSCDYTSVDYSKGVRMAIWQTDCQNVIKRMLKVSDNLNAEAMFYRLGGLACNNSHPATAKDGVAAIKRMISIVGLNSMNYNIADGSGLSNYDYLSPELEVAFLRYAYEHTNIFNTIYPSLPIAGVDGSLKDRMTDPSTAGNVHAKTGSYTAIISLAGYLTSKVGDKIVFSIMNQNIFPDTAAQKFQDDICRLLCQ